MNLDFCLTQLAVNVSAIHQLVATVSDAQARWRPTATEWSILEVIHHLYDEEREDFRARIRHLFAGNPGRWAPIDPAGWVQERHYNEQHLGPTLTGLLLEREASLSWLRGLEGVDWSVAYAHGALTGLTAGDLLAAWVTHDLLHLRQLIELKYSFTTTQIAPFAARYAGPWAQSDLAT